MEDHLVVVLGMMAFFNHSVHGTNGKHYIFEPLNYRINLSIWGYL